MLRAQDGLGVYVDLHVGVDRKHFVHEGHEIAHRVKTEFSKGDSPRRRRASGTSSLPVGTEHLKNSLG